jgi:hypothetical protein
MVEEGWRGWGGEEPKVQNQKQPEEHMLPKLLSMRASLSVALQVEQKIMKENEEQRADVT